MVVGGSRKETHDGAGLRLNVPFQFRQLFFVVAADRDGTVLWRAFYTDNCTARPFFSLLPFGGGGRRVLCFSTVLSIIVVLKGVFFLALLGYLQAPFFLFDPRALAVISACVRLGVKVAAVSPDNLLNYVGRCIILLLLLRKRQWW